MQFILFLCMHVWRIQYYQCNVYMHHVYIQLSVSTSGLSRYEKKRNVWVFVVLFQFRQLDRHAHRCLAWWKPCGTPAGSTCEILCFLPCLSITSICPLGRSQPMLQSLLCHCTEIWQKNSIICTFTSISLFPLAEHSPKRDMRGDWVIFEADTQRSLYYVYSKILSERSGGPFGAIQDQSPK